MELQIVVAYDIANDKRRDKIARCLQGYGVRVNYSVFECVIKPGKFRMMKHELGELIHPKEDSIRIYQVCKECAKKTEVMGCGQKGFESSGLLYIW